MAAMVVLVVITTKPCVLSLIRGCSHQSNRVASKARKGLAQASPFSIDDIFTRMFLKQRAK
jgi:hypothetical protein